MTEDIQPSQLSTSNTTWDFDVLSAGLSVDVGDTYPIRLRNTAPGGGCTYAWSGGGTTYGQPGLINGAANPYWTMEFTSYIDDAGGVGGPTLAATGSCSSNLTVALGNMTPGGTAGWAIAPQPGTLTFANGVCAGTQTGLSRPITQSGTFTVPASGGVTSTFPMPPNWCGQLLQIVDLDTCATTDVVQLP